ncbi:hypothetical protein K443DRAFT_609214 [Laccaria amethystina LaAM-08-1]|uniref:Uncharacterized protein n=1 Tax=Laccaria amethystina LaAM-08-1 TaxID=1095629 RepID=A0A0C9YCL3_9AGAR|nr:hypothetical protein K443DRAFT_609214 [Laccaria amethystina LaAM-08-1]
MASYMTGKSPISVERKPPRTVLNTGYKCERRLAFNLVLNRIPHSKILLHSNPKSTFDLMHLMLNARRRYLDRMAATEAIPSIGVVLFLLRPGEMI